MVPEYQLTIVVPVYNEVESLPRFKEEMDKYLTQTPVASKVLFVNDGSDDGSLELIKDICHGKGAEHYYYVSLEKNCGLSAAIKTGIDLCDTQYLGYIDADLQTSPSDFLKYLEHINGCTLINGIRSKRKDTVVKRLSSKIANGFRRLMINDGIADTCCPLKLMQADAAKKLPFFKGMHRFIPALIQLQGGEVKQLEVQHFERSAGTAKYHLLNRLAGPFIDTLVFVWMRKKNIQYKISEVELVHE
ncbi:glycosyltransferase family 2 protein [Fulvivirga ulvae]|uniref:glycosyltransferase family 2 protein n=1 Tax=Fulvivirga ulvae TaxID=2904245 RepID=UPI001F40F424|nr:glycosyltransferase family 2 protein [Fulvivirga ulvae]UII29657.1 glycosyltransferase family 2 protein [Fulvivirga ulvae]